MIESFCIFLGTGIPLEGIVASSLWCFVFLFSEFYCFLAIHFPSYSGFSICTSRLIAYFGDMGITRKKGNALLPWVISMYVTCFLLFYLQSDCCYVHWVWAKWLCLPSTLGLSRHILQLCESIKHMQSNAEITQNRSPFSF